MNIYCNTENQPKCWHSDVCQNVDTPEKKEEARKFLHELLDEFLNDLTADDFKSTFLVQVCESHKSVDSVVKTQKEEK